MAKNKIYYGTTLLIDLTADTVTAPTLAKGITAHDRHGDVIVGTGASTLAPLYYDYNIGYVSNGTWTYENPTNTYTDIYQVQAGHPYLISLGANVGTRFRAMFTTTDVTTVTSGSVVGTNIININNPAAYRNVSYTPPSDGYIIIGKDNIGESGIFTYVFDKNDWV